MIGVVLAAGSGSRLRPLRADRPKALIEVGGRPLVGWSLRALGGLRPERVIVVVGDGREQVMAELGRGFEGIPLQYARQAAPTGSADAILAAEPWLEEAEVVAVINGDNVFATDLSPVLRVHMADRRDATLLVERLPPAEALQGVCRVENGRVIGIVEHPTAAQRREGVVSAGFYLFSPPPLLDACRRVPPSGNGEHELAEAVNLMIREGRGVGAAWLDGMRVNVNRPEDLVRAERLLARAPEQPKPPGRGPGR